jgi:hypothetical protein
MRWACFDRVCPILLLIEDCFEIIPADLQCVKRTPCFFVENDLQKRKISLPLQPAIKERDLSKTNAGMFIKRLW